MEWKGALDKIKALPNFNRAHVAQWKARTEAGRLDGGLWVSDPTTFVLIILNEQKTDLKYIIYIKIKEVASGRGLRETAYELQPKAFFRYDERLRTWAGPRDARLF